MLFSALYAIPPHHQRRSFQKQDQLILSDKEKPPEKRMERNKQDETLGSWFKIMIPFGIKYNETWLLNLIQKQSSVPFTAFKFHYEKMQAQFFFENANTARALKNVSGKIFNENNEKISIFVEPCDTSQSVQRALKSEKVEQIKLFSLDLSKKKHYLVHGLSTIMENASTTKNVNLSSTEVKAAGEMDEGQQLEPEGMCADRNDVCTTFPDMSTILRYYLIHGYGDRLLGAYHEEVCFSLTIPFQPEDTALSMCAYFLDKRNMKSSRTQWEDWVEKGDLHVQLLKHTKHDFMHALCALPKTQHDFSFFVMDMCFQVEMMLCFSVNGVFKEELYFCRNLRVFCRQGHLRTGEFLESELVISSESFRAQPVLRDLSPSFKGEEIQKRVMACAQDIFRACLQEQGLAEELIPTCGNRESSGEPFPEQLWGSHGTVKITPSSMPGIVV
ncbi:nuclear RNA export factor 3-like [Dama dama]